MIESAHGAHRRRGTHGSTATSHDGTAPDGGCGESEPAALMMAPHVPMNPLPEETKSGFLLVLVARVRRNEGCGKYWLVAPDGPQSVGFHGHLPPCVVLKATQPEWVTSVADLESQDAAETGRWGADSWVAGVAHRLAKEMH